MIDFFNALPKIIKLAKSSQARLEIFLLAKKQVIVICINQDMIFLYKNDSERDIVFRVEGILNP